jgi:hypothetical protein
MKKLIIVIAAALFVAGSVLPAVAQDKANWSFYGSARFWTAWNMKDGNTPAGLLGSPGIPGFDDDDLTWQMQDNSRIGANVAWGNVGGRFEYGNSTGGNFESIRLRLLYGTWNFGPGTLLIGQDYTPLFFPISDQCGYIGGDCGLIFWGTVYTGRVPQVKITMGGLKIGLMNPSTAVKIGGADVDTTLPELEASYTFNLGPAAIMVGGAYKTYDNRVIVAGAERDYSIDCWLLNAAARFNFGPFYVNASLAYGDNIGDYSLTADISSVVKTSSYVAATDSMEDSENWLAALILGFKLSDEIKFEAGVGYVSGERNLAPGITREDTTMAYYLQMAWSPVKNVFIIPELGMVDYGDSEVTGQPDADQGSASYLGIKWQINF